MRLWIARRPRDPLLSYLILAGREPFLRQNLHQPRLQIYDIEREGRVIGIFGRIAGRDRSVRPPAQLRWHFDLVHAGGQAERDFEIGNGLRGGVNAFARLLEPAGNFREVKSLELIGIETGEANAPALGAPYPQMRFGGTKNGRQ